MSPTPVKFHIQLGGSTKVVMLVMRIILFDGDDGDGDGDDEDDDAERTAEVPMLCGLI
jgi:hypothetical protein